MEIRARYTLIGTFTLAVIAAVFMFVYWLNGSGALRYGSRYQIRFENYRVGAADGLGRSLQRRARRRGHRTCAEPRAAAPGHWRR